MGVEAGGHDADLVARHLAEDRGAVDRLLREAQAAASVDHPAVVTVYEAGLAEGRPVGVWCYPFPVPRSPGDA